MGYIKEPKGIDFIIAPSVLNDEDKQMFREAIAVYKKTGKTSESTDISSVVNSDQQDPEHKKPVTYTIKKKKLKDK